MQLFRKIFNGGSPSGRSRPAGGGKVQGAGEYTRAHIVNPSKSRARKNQ